jgi:hypothetical protein
LNPFYRSKKRDSGFRNFAIWGLEKLEKKLKREITERARVRLFGTPIFLYGAVAPLCCAKIGSWRSTKQTFGAEILVQIGPVNTISATRDFPVFPLCRGCRQQAWIPC